MCCLLLLWGACHEIAPIITPNITPITMPDDGGDTLVENQQRQVLIEEFTGVRCVNCPAGSQAIETLLDIHGERLVAVSIHAGFFSVPYDAATEFRTPEGNNLLSYLGAPLGFPTAVVNRKKFPTEENLQIGQGKWAGYIAEELALPPIVKIGLTRTYDAATRSLELTSKLFVQETITGEDLRLSVMLLESGPVGRQLTPQGEQADYVHKHVLRTMLSPYDGLPINEPFTSGAEITRTFNYSIPAGWVAEKCRLVVFVSRNGETKEVLQAHEIAVVE